jgi:hypothetical protein
MGAAWQWGNGVGLGRREGTGQSGCALPSIDIREPRSMRVSDAKTAGHFLEVPRWGDRVANGAGRQNPTFVKTALSHCAHELPDGARLAAQASRAILSFSTNCRPSFSR